MENEISKLKIPALDVREVGFVKDVKRGLARVWGLPSCVFGQLLGFTSGVKGLVMGFNLEDVMVIILGQDSQISVGDQVVSLAELITIPAGENFVGRIVNALGEPIDGKGEIQPADYRNAFQEAPGVIEREPVERPMVTGIKIIDLAIPVGRGQRELIIGDRQTGKSSIGIDTIINQRGGDVICVYCWIGGPQSALKKILSILEQKGAMRHTIVVCASADASAAEQYLAPYTASALGEHFMYNGKDALVVFDDLTKHAWIYRQMSLLMERSPGREAYPGDIFYLHSRLLERAAQLRKDKGGGSMTFLPIAETLQGDITGYIQTNLISITDGQIYINSALFREGFKPAIDMGLSVSRIGSRVQCPGIKELGKGLRLDYAQYREMLRLTKLRTLLSDEAMAKMKHGEVLHELLMQPNYEPLSTEQEIAMFYAFKRGILEVVSPPSLRQFITEFFSYLKEENVNLVERIRQARDLSTDIKSELDIEYSRFFKKLKAEDERRLAGKGQ
jgi:F-type H+-transporting ATPase subunit alpha